jgi:dTDP-4-dehydrorhamnose reductase
MSIPSEPSDATPLEVWGGVECTVNRVGDAYFDQMERSGHAVRVDDLDLFAGLRISAMRYPVLWERTAPDGLEAADWSWADARLMRLRELSLRPIVGLVHHGSGPRATSLVDPTFPSQLAEFARAVASRYPWVEDYTPVNEPLTTARFSGLYGHWYPHGRNAETFARALVAQCRAVVLSMRAVREINPKARLVQTEDLGKTHSTRALSYQAEFENERRWLTFDLLCGRVGKEHPMWEYLRWAGVAEPELEWLLANTCPPDIVGVNHYMTSERFLDERVERYPAPTHGGNGRHKYADVEAVRVLAEGPAGPRALLMETWERYRLPIAVTEAHLGCTREEQLRWLKEMWDAARSARAQGADVRALTAWALLGSHDWNSLLTRRNGYYEPGVFDVRGARPRPTALARALREMTGGREPDHPVLDSPGWWRRLDRLQYLPEQPLQRQRRVAPASREQWTKTRRGRARALLITGATGTLGRAFARVCHARAIPYHLLTRKELDIADPASVEAALNGFEPWAIVNAAGFVRVDDAERDAEACLRENSEGPATLAAACAARGVALVTFSSDLVFDGSARKTAYVESDAPAPLGVYGRSKADAETRVLAALPSTLVIRTSAFFGPWDEHNFVTASLRALAAGQRFAAADDATVSPTYVPDLVHASLDLLIDAERGVWHLANEGAVTWADLARLAAGLAGFDAGLVNACSTLSLGFVAQRPAYSALGSERGTLLPPLEDALSRYMRDCEVALRGARAVAGAKGL